MGGPHSYGVKCNLSVKAMEILRDECEMTRHCSCDKANLPLDTSTSAKRKQCGDPEDGTHKNRKPVKSTEEDTVMFDYNTFVDQQGLDIADGKDDQDDEELLPGMNPAGYTSSSNYAPTMDESSDNLPSETIPGKQVTKKDSFYIQAVDGNIVIDDSDDEEVVIQENTRLNASRGFGEGEIIVIDDD